MKLSLISLSFAILAIVDYAAASVCNADNVGQRIALPTSCSKFLVCSRNRRVVVRECPRGLHFNRELEMCDLPSRANCRYASVFAAVNQCETCDCNVCCAPKPEVTTPPCGPEEATTPKPTTQKPTTQKPTTQKPTTTTTCEPEVTTKPTTQKPTTKPTTQKPTTQAPTTTTTCEPEVTTKPTTQKPTTKPTTQKPTTQAPTTTTTCEPEVTTKPTTQKPTTQKPTTQKPTTTTPCESEVTTKPTTQKPTTQKPTTKPTTQEPTPKPTTQKPNTPTTSKPDIPPPSTPSECEGVCCGQPNGIKLAGNTCQEFIVCQDNQVVTFECPNNLHFNTATGDCDFPENANCNKPSAPGPHAGPSGTTCANSGRCAGKRDGTYFADANNKCSAKYVVCQCECEVERSCNASLLFNEKLGVCDWPAAIGC